MAARAGGQDEWRVSSARYRRTGGGAISGPQKGISWRSSARSAFVGRAPGVPQRCVPGITAMRTGRGRRAGPGCKNGGVGCKSAGPGRQPSRCRREWRPEAARRSFGAPPQTSRWRGARRAVAASGAPVTGRRAIPDRPCARWLPLNHEQPAGQKCPSALEAQPIEPRSTIKSEGPTGQRRPWSLTGGLALTSAGRGIPKCAGCH